jgi:outer membrane protein OmpA-like peptidoglycan-associated protein
MKKTLLRVFITVLSVILFACSIPQPKINYFTADSSSIIEGNEVTLKWSVAGAKSVSILKVEKDLAVEGSIAVKPLETTTYILKANYAGDIETTSQITIKVEKPKVIVEETPKSEPSEENINRTNSKYFKGTINYENVSDKSKINHRIFSIDQTKYPNEIKLFVNVFDVFGNKIANLAPPYNLTTTSFWNSLSDSCNKLNEISKFNIVEKREKDLPPISVSYVLDFSGSMSANINLLIDAYNKSSKYIRAEDDYTTVQFSSFPYPIIKLTSDKTKFSQLLDFSLIAGSTAFYSASVVGIENLKESKKQKIAILMTDGQDNASFFERKIDVINKARETNTRIFVIGFTNPYFSNEKDLIDIAEQTGGMYYSVSDANDFDDIYDEIFQSLRVYYEITYKANDCGENKHLVKLTTEPIKGTKVVAAKPYFIKPDVIEGERTFLACNFDHNSSFIDSVADVQYKKFADYINNNKSLKLEIYGYTSTLGSEPYNLSLSKRRANAFKNKLTSKQIGLNKKPITKVEGKGENDLIYNPDELEWQQRENRRIMIKVK